MLIKNAIVCDVDGERESDILIENGFISKIGTNLSSEDSIDANGSYFMPLLVDTNVRLLDSTLNSKNIKNLSKEALKGGVGHIVLNADSTPAIDNEVVLEFAQHSLNSLDGAKVDLMLNSLKEDMTLTDIAILLKKGVIAPYMSTIAKNNLAIKIAQYVQMYDVTLFCKAEDNSMINSGVMLEGDVSSELGLAGIADLSEILHVSRMIEIAKYFNIRILFKSISSPRSISLINSAKKDGVNVSCEVSLTHLTLSDQECEGFNTLAKINPPLAMQDDVLKLQKALQNGQIDILTTLHKPHSLVNKEVAFYDAAYGSAEICNALSLYYTYLVKTEFISMQELVKLTVQNPAKAIGKNEGELNLGDEINIVIFNPNITSEVTNKQSLYNEKILQGKVTHLVTKEKVHQF